MNKAVTLGILTEEDFYAKSETEIIEQIEKSPQNTGYFAHLYKTFRTMESIEHTSSPLPEDEYFCINLKVKQRFINPLVRDGEKVARLSELSSSSRKIIEDFKTYSDSAYGCVKHV